MKNLFVILITYQKSLEEIELILPKHRDFLRKGY